MTWNSNSPIVFVVAWVQPLPSVAVMSAISSSVGSSWRAVGAREAMIAVGMHLLHGIWGACMTLGLNTSLKRAEQIRFVAILVATLIVVGFLIPPFAILFGFVD